MDFRYSEVVDLSTYRTDGLCDGIPLRRHKDTIKEIDGALEAQKDWSKFVGPVTNYHGALGKHFTFICVIVPECLPERLKILSYTTEFGLLYDDVMESIEYNLDNENSRQVQENFANGALSLDANRKSHGENLMQAKILQGMLAIDQERALIAMKAWATYIEQVASRKRPEPFTSLEEYLPYRVTDAGEMFWYGLVTFGMALTIPDSEFNLCSTLVRPGFSAISLTNDLYSWEKERDVANKEGISHVFNAIWIIMTENSVTEEEAKQICRLKVKEYVAEFDIVVQETKENPNISRDLKVYVEAIQYSVIGNLVWAIYCPRYHAEIC